LSIDLIENGREKRTFFVRPVQKETKRISSSILGKEKKINK
jgi:hypothetical protein